MNRYRMRVVLLSLGVLFGYGSAFAHVGHHDRDPDRAHRHAHCHGDDPFW
ncbi:MAG: hypothetical protein ABW252_19510 [Polyangiales bacterium]